MKQAPPVVVMKKEIDMGDDCRDGESTSNGENGLGMPLLRDPYAMHHSRPGASATLQRIPSHHSSSAYSAAGIARAQSQQQLALTTMAQVSSRIFAECARDICESDVSFFAGLGSVFVLQLEAGVRATPPGPAAAATTTTAAAAPVVGAVPATPSANHNAAKTVNESAALPTL
jgi:hypothetical protein